MWQQVPWNFSVYIQTVPTQEKLNKLYLVLTLLPGTACLKFWTGLALGQVVQWKNEHSASFQENFSYSTAYNESLLLCWFMPSGKGNARHSWFILYFLLTLKLLDIILIQLTSPLFATRINLKQWNVLNGNNFIIYFSPWRCCSAGTQRLNQLWSGSLQLNSSVLA